MGAEGSAYFSGHFEVPPEPQGQVPGAVLDLLDSVPRPDPHTTVSSWTGRREDILDLLDFIDVRIPDGISDPLVVARPLWSIDLVERDDAHEGVVLCRNLNDEVCGSFVKREVGWEFYGWDPSNTPEYEILPTFGPRSISDY